MSKTKNTTDAENPADDDEGNDNVTMDHPELPNEVSTGFHAGKYVKHKDNEILSAISQANTGVHLLV